MNLFIVLGLARANQNEVRSERARVEIQGCPTFAFEPWTLNRLIFDNLGFTRQGPQADGGRYLHWVNMCWLCASHERLLQIGALDASTERRSFAETFPTMCHCSTRFLGVARRSLHRPLAHGHGRNIYNRSPFLQPARFASDLSGIIAAREVCPLWSAQTGHQHLHCAALDETRRLALLPEIVTTHGVIFVSKLFDAVPRFRPFRFPFGVGFAPSRRLRSSRGPWRLRGPSPGPPRRLRGSRRWSWGSCRLCSGRRVRRSLASACRHHEPSARGAADALVRSRRCWGPSRPVAARSWDGL